MLKKSITYYNLDEKEVTEDFYFAFTKLELMETELEIGGIEQTIERLQQTQNVKEAYKIFKQLILAAYGEKSDDGRYFLKEDDNGRPLSKKFEASPAMSELILEFLSDPQAGAKFMQGCLPANLVKQFDDAQAVLKAAEDVPEPEVPVVEEKKPLQIEDFSREELLEMPKQQFDELAGTDPRRMDKDVMVIAMERMTQGR